VLTVLFDDGLGVLHSHTRTDRGYVERPKCSRFHQTNYPSKMDRARSTSCPI
jgi:hypothetical protein